MSKQLTPEELALRVQHLETITKEMDRQVTQYREQNETLAAELTATKSSLAAFEALGSIESIGLMADKVTALESQVAGYAELGSVEDLKSVKESFESFSTNYGTVEELEKLIEVTESMLPVLESYRAIAASPEELNEVINESEERLAAYTALGSVEELSAVVTRLEEEAHTKAVSNLSEKFGMTAESVEAILNKVPTFEDAEELLSSVLSTKPGSTPERSPSSLTKVDESTDDKTKKLRSMLGIRK